MKKTLIFIILSFVLAVMFSLNVTADMADRSYSIELTENGSEYILLENDEEGTANKVVIILLPSVLDLNEFLDSTEWSKYASEYNYNLAVLNSDWINDPEGSEGLYEDVYWNLASRMVFTDKDVFIAGYDEGARFAVEEVCRNHERYTGLLSFGNYGLSKEQGAEYSTDVCNWNMNVWISNTEETTLLKYNVDIWKKINNIIAPFDEQYKTDYANYLYMPLTSVAGEINEEDDGTGIVYFDIEDSYYSPLVTAKVSRYFISAINGNTAGFSCSVQGRELLESGDYRFSYFRQNFEGAQREYWMYLPSSYKDNGEPASLLLCLHGNCGSGADMINRTQWNIVAEDNNCIVVFPSSLYKESYQHYWQNIDEEMDWLWSLIEQTCREYNVDKSRIYVTGYSNGAGMAHNMAMNFSDIIAAAGMGAPIYSDEDYYGVPDNVYPVAVIYSVGTKDKYLYKYFFTAEIDDYPAVSHLAYWRMLYGFDQYDFDYLSVNGKEIYTFYTMNDIPICSWVVIWGKGHTYPAAECQNMWDFLSSYTKDDEGNLYYLGEKVSIE